MAARRSSRGFTISVFFLSSLLAFHSSSFLATAEGPSEKLVGPESTPRTRWERVNLRSRSCVTGPSRWKTSDSFDRSRELQDSREAIRAGLCREKFNSRSVDYAHRALHALIARNFAFAVYIARTVWKKEKENEKIARATDLFTKTPTFTRIWSYSKVRR